MTGWESFKTASDFGEHAVNEDPLVEPDLSLNEESPCINAGIFSPYVSEDFAGLPRPSGSAPDIGAYEVQQPENVNITSHSEIIKIYPNPGSDIIYLQYPDNLTVNRISILGLNGWEIIAYSMVNFSSDEKSHVLKIDYLPMGFYLLLFETNTGNHTEKIIVL